jgi:hypothetical protein
VIWPDLADVNILSGVNEEAPPQNEEPDEENSRVQTSCVCRVEVGCSQSAQEDERDCHACCSDKQECSPSPAIDVQCCPDVADDGECRPASIQQQRSEALESEGCVYEDAVVGEHEDTKKLIAPHHDRSDQ